MKVWPTGVGKSLAVGVGTLVKSGERDVDLLEEGMLQLHESCGGLGQIEGGVTAGINGRDAGLRAYLMKESLRTWVCFGCSARAFCGAGQGRKGQAEWNVRGR